MTPEQIKALREKRQGEHNELIALLERAAGENRNLTVDEQATETRLNESLNSSGTLITEAEQRNSDLRSAQEARDASDAALEQLLARADMRGKPGGPAGREQGGNQVDEMTQVRDWLNGRSGSRTLEIRAGRPMGTEEFRVLSKLTAGAGANTVKTSFYDKLMAHLIEVSGIMQAGPTILNTSTGEQILVPKTTSHSTAALVAEAGAIGASDPVFAQAALDAYKYAVLLQVSHELANDTSVDLLDYLAMQAGRAVGNAFGVHAMVGTGSSQPQGLIPAATVGITGSASVAGAFTADNLIDLFYSVIAPYRNSPSAKWLMRDATMGAVRKLKDSQGQYLWQPSVQEGVPDTLLSKGIVTDPNIAAVGLAARSVAFGDISQYFVRMVESLRFERSDDYAFNTDLITYRCILRADGELVDTTGAVKVFVGNAA